MAERIYNFSSGPAMLPLPVLEQAQAELLSFDNSGMSVMELSHRSALFGRVLESARDGLRRLLSIPDNYEVIFVQGGASLQFAMLPMNFLSSGGHADFVVTGAWGEKAVAEAAKFGRVEVVFTSKPDGYRTTPPAGVLNIDATADYLHYTSNETIHGVEFKYDLEGYGVPVICDASSNLLSRPIDVSKYSVIYAGAQKNIGPGGVAVIIAAREMLDRVPDSLPSMLDLRKIADNDSMLNTPNTWGIYLIDLVCKWLEKQGGVQAIAAVNAAKAESVYQAIDASDGFYSGHAAVDARSAMNITFRLRSEELERQFCTEAEALGLSGLAGHRSVGGIRASMYNAFPKEGAVRLAEFMQDFSRRKRD